jgi:proteasome lid subunit RPN8/RPN11
MVLELRRRGEGKGESGAFLLGLRQGLSAQVSQYVCYDDLDPQACQYGAVTFHAEGYAALWQYCREKSVEVLADLHTHPGKSVQQSSIDRRNPMLPVVGHIAAILPNYGYTPWWSLRGVGIYEYLGDLKWRAYGPSESHRPIILRLW